MVQYRRWLVYLIIVALLVAVILFVWQLWNNWPRFELVDSLTFFGDEVENVPALPPEDDLSATLGLMSLQELNGRAILELDQVARVVVRCLGEPCRLPREGTPEFNPKYIRLPGSL